MAIFLYNLSPVIHENLDSIDNLRRQFLLTPLSPGSELQLRWEAAVNQIYWSLSLTQNPISRQKISKLLTTLNKQRLTDQEKEIVNYKKALIYISQQWTASSLNTTAKHILLVDSLAYGARLTKRYWQPVLPIWEKFLQYLQTGSDHPIIQAGIAQINLSVLSPVPEDDGRTSRLVGLLFLYKYGYDLRGSIELEEFFKRNIADYNRIQASIKDTQNLTAWLEFYTEAVKSQISRILSKINSGQIPNTVSANFWKLNDRQKQILALLEQPNISITNKKAQKLFRVSQITSSRDLAKLTSLGFLFSHGKGRSVFYTRV